MPLEVTITPENMLKLAPLIRQAAPPPPGGPRRGSLRLQFDGIGKLLVGDELAPVVKSILSNPNWTKLSAKVSLKKVATAARYAHETSGIAFKGKQIATDRTSQARLAALAAVVTATPGLADHFHWKCADGTFVELTPADVLTLNAAVHRHVQAAYTLEAQLHEGIEAGGVKTEAQIHTAFK